MQANAAARASPFAGVPGELGAEVEKVLEQRARAPRAGRRRSPRPSCDAARSPSRTFLRPHARPRSLGAFVLVVIETIALQAGPAAHRRSASTTASTRRTASVLVVVALAFVGVGDHQRVAGYVRTAFTGRLGEKLMYQLRIRVFSHLQRLSLDFYTDEKGGVLMTRMTSDIEALTQLFQDGLVNFAVQGLTLVVITVILFTLDVQLALITVVLVVPADVRVDRCGSGGRPTRATARVRDRIADVLADLSESLSGIRIIAAYNRRRHNVVHHHNVVGGHLDANLYTARVGAIYAPGTEAIGVHRPGGHAAGSAARWCSTAT